MTNLKADGKFSCTRRQAKQRDNNCCRLCSSPHNLQVHHIVWQCFGGGHHIDNLTTLCSDCHMYQHKQGQSGFVVLRNSEQINSSRANSA
jgi:5-methylcytosine-specific restriction endonuclease McrA